MILSVSPLLSIHSLTMGYHEGDQVRPVLSDLRLTAAHGETLVILGRSGSGKSTLLNLICGIDQPESGSVEVDGVPLIALSERERTLFRRRHIGFVYQFFNLIPTLTVLENLLLPLELNGMVAEGRERAEALLEEVGLAGREESFPDQLSGGEQQRVAIARALVHRPKLVLADEPTGNLDRESGGRILELLDRLTRRAGHTLVMVTHSDEAAAYADRLLRIEDGALVEENPLEGRGP